MSYIKLGPEFFQDETGEPSFKFLSAYCKAAPAKFIYDGRIPGNDYYKLVFKNIVGCKTIVTNDISYQFPDLISAENVLCFIDLDQDILIGKLNSVTNFYLTSEVTNLYNLIKYIRKNINIIDANTLIINGNKLTVTEKWAIGGIFQYDKITSENYFNYIYK